MTLAIGKYLTIVISILNLEFFIEITIIRNESSLIESEIVKTVLLFSLESIIMKE